MSKRLTLAAVMNKFMQTHPNYKPNLMDVNECMIFVSNNFAPLLWSTDGELSKMGTIIEERNRKIAELKHEITMQNFVIKTLSAEQKKIKNIAL